MSAISEEELVNAVKARSQEVRAATTSYSVRELRSMFEEGQINIRPEFQRTFRWTKEQKSSLIESMLLSIPLPSVFVSEDFDGDWDVVDGVQRLSTIFSFMGMTFPDSDNNLESGDNSMDGADEEALTDSGRDSEFSLEPFALSRLEHLVEAEDLSWIDLPRALKRKLETTRIDVTMLESTSSAEAKYNLFLRLNSGASLTQQELRNCLLLMVNPSFFKTIKSCAQNEDFLKLVQLSDRKSKQAFSDELVLRFFMQSEFSGDTSSLREDFGEYLTAWAKGAALREESSYTPDTDLFNRTVSLVLSAGGSDALRRLSEDGKSRRGPASNAAFEFVMSGVSNEIDFWESTPETLQGLLSDFWTSDEFREHVGSGVNARDRFPKMINFGRQYFKRR
ncbi:MULTISPECIES: DUF262 domain-containing protein [Corynebacterium]|uniref:Uncharacterized conserved protein n=1 Tax=Corynebacterium segmentosum TaxID=43990 RepID=A0ABY6TCB0_9CORY|nr:MULTISPECIES: DUF262 domain-containing protein [Corynebacterium]EEI15417.1 hypothetical protein HMPREF0276_0032 [Corynebacterium accolens ATCC 49725]UQZ27506.1 hypothetical protein CACC_03945 [Corynebacterium accolens]VEH72443.1 Uncharacterized conserved protein [Corynebacterium segmentosum]